MKNKVGIIGGGQLGRMLALAAIPLGFEVLVLDPTPNCPAAVCAKQIVGSFKDAEAVFALAKQVDYLTFEIESANAVALNTLAQQNKHINPQPQMLALIKDKFAQKQFYQKHAIPCAASVKVENKEEIKQAAAEFSYPIVLKARFDAYDGRGNVVINNESEIEVAFVKLGEKNLYVEQFVPFRKELAVMVARSVNGDLKSYPVVESIQKNNICHTVIAPAQVDTEIIALAQQFAEKVVGHLQGAGVFGIEMFLTQDNQVLINEIAPRVHNTGHYTMEACVTSQFEQHIRAVCGLPLGATAMKVPAAVMMNILGQREGMADIQGLQNVLLTAGVSVHFYGKAETKAERKMGHLTAIADNIDAAMKKAQNALTAISI
jgi:phosphoribosylaminoimidazole carboxylase PurK protein